MHTNYDDIVSSVATPPIWWDEMAVPRYCQFTPRKSAGMLVKEIALVEIQCQECWQTYAVAMSRVNFRESSLADAISSKTLDFGDPPNHSNNLELKIPCSSGYCMGSLPDRVLQYWYWHEPRSRADLDPVDWWKREWSRDSSKEVIIRPDYLWDIGRPPMRE